MSNVIDTLPNFPFSVEVSADYAMFTNKKDQRISYPVPTSGAVRGLLESIFWKPAIKYVPRKVEVLNPIRRTSIKKNELKQGWKKDMSPVSILEDRIQRNNSYLCDVRYRIHADCVLLPEEYRKEFYVLNKKWQKYENDENVEKYFNQLKRRVEHGQHYNDVFLGTRECICNDVEWIDETSEKSNPIQVSNDLGMMYIDYVYTEDYTASQRDMMMRIIGKETGKSKITGEFRPRPVFANVRMTDGVVEYPSKYDILDQMIGQMECFWSI